MSIMSCRRWLYKCTHLDAFKIASTIDGLIWCRIDGKDGGVIEKLQNIDLICVVECHQQLRAGSVRCEIRLWERDEIHIVQVRKSV